MFLLILALLPLSSLCSGYYLVLSHHVVHLELDRAVVVLSLCQAAPALISAPSFPAGSLLRDFASALTCSGQLSWLLASTPNTGCAPGRNSIEEPNTQTLCTFLDVLIIRQPPGKSKEGVLTLLGLLRGTAAGLLRASRGFSARAAAVVALGVVLVSTCA